MNLQQLINSEEPIYVKNVSKRATGKDLLIMLNFKDSQGNNRPVKLKSWKYPVDITKLVAPRRLLGESTDFLRLLNSGILEIVPSEKAERLLSSPDAQAAMLREQTKKRPGMTKADKSKFNLKVRGESLHDQELPDTDGVSDFEHDHMFDDNMNAFDGEVVSDPEAEEFRAKSDGVDPRIAQMMAMLSEDSDSKDEILQDLKSMDEDGMTDNDLGYILEKARSFSAIVSWAKKVLAARQPAPEPTSSKKKRGRPRKRS